MKYQIKGEPMPVVICQLEDGESVICESGAMSWMSPNLEMETSGGGAGKVFGRMFSGEGMFQNRYTARKGAGMIAFASKFPGDIRAVEITRDSPVICQKGAFLASTEGVELSVAFQQKFSTGLFGGEGLFNTLVTGPGRVVIQTMPISGFAAFIASLLPRKS